MKIVGRFTSTPKGTPTPVPEVPCSVQQPVGGRSTHSGGEDLDGPEQNRDLADLAQHGSAVQLRDDVESDVVGVALWALILVSSEWKRWRGWCRAKRGGAATRRTSVVSGVGLCPVGVGYRCQRRAAQVAAAATATPALASSPTRSRPTTAEPGDQGAGSITAGVLPRSAPRSWSPPTMTTAATRIAAGARALVAPWFFTTTPWRGRGRSGVGRGVVPTASAGTGGRPAAAPAESQTRSGR